ncbi:MAG: VWA domain-containing protein [Candidatus Omnitrophica bacterium]|nr:VWA domain-containing protein [Candidatus Omnitrophota bacterium]
MQFYKPEYLIYLWLAPAVLLLFGLSRALWRRRLRKLIQERALLTKLVQGYRGAEWTSRAVLTTLAVLCLVVALARPQWGDEKRSVQRKGVDIVFLVDTSLSMLAEDIKPSRIEKAKFEVQTFVRNLRGDRVGMVTFAGSGFLQTPLTLDHAAFLLFLDAVQVGFLPDPGTSLAQAIHLALRAFPQKELKYKAMVLFTDGEDFEGGLDASLAAAKEAGVRIYAIGLGSSEGEPIPLKNERGERSGFKKDRGGQMVLTKLNAPLLEKVAKETGGIYLPGTPGEKEVDLILKHLRAWGEQQFSEKTVVEKEDQYQVFLVFAFILLVLEMLVRRRDRKAAAWLGCFFAFFAFSGFWEPPQTTIKKGNEHYEEKRYQSAIEAYRKVQVRDPDAPEVRYDLGTALYKTDAHQEAAQHLEAATKTEDPELQARAYYNFGNAQYRLGNFEKAIDAYKKTLDLDPSDEDAKYNLEFLQKKKSAFEKKDQERKKNNDQKDQQQQPQSGQQDQQNQGQGQQDQQSQGQQGKQDPQDSSQEEQDPQQSQSQAQQGQDQETQQQEQPSQQDQQQDEQQKQEQQEEEERQRQEQEQQEREAQARRDEERQEEEKAGEQPEPYEPKEGAEPRRPLQGQMSQENALNILDALKESEKELQDLRRPPVNRNPPVVEKDW